jgi:hypothetical protein
VRRILKELKETSSKLNIKAMVIHMAVFATFIVSLIVYLIFAATLQDLIYTIGFISLKDTKIFKQDLCMLGYDISKMTISEII